MKTVINGRILNVGEQKQRKVPGETKDDGCSVMRSKVGNDDVLHLSVQGQSFPSGKNQMETDVGTLKRPVVCKKKKRQRRNSIRKKETLKIAHKSFRGEFCR